MKKITTSILFLALSLSACKDQIPLPPASAGIVSPAVSTASNNVPTGHWDIQAQAAQWKQALIAEQQVGDACPTEFISEKSAAWRETYPFAQDGWSGVITYTLADFNGDKKNDLLMYFASDNCAGHNGSNPMFARIVYSDGTSSRSNLMVDIRDAIFREYDEMRKQDKKLIEVYRTTTTIGNDTFFGQNDFDETTVEYHYGIKGQVMLYAKNSRLTPCAKCAYFEGKYTFDPIGKKVKLSLTKRAY